STWLPPPCQLPARPEEEQTRPTKDTVTQVAGSVNDRNARSSVFPRRWAEVLSHLICRQSEQTRVAIARSDRSPMAASARGMRAQKESRLAAAQERSLLSDVSRSTSSP